MSFDLNGNYNATIYGDIKNAYPVEQDYAINNLGTKVNLIDLLSPYGYKNLDEYFSDRFLYLLSQQNLSIEHCIVSEVQSMILDKFNAGIGQALAVNENCTWAFVGNPEYFDYDKANELGVKICELGYAGGPIITDNNDFNLSINLPMPSTNAQSDKFLEQFNDYLCSKGYNTHIDRNDILLPDNKKVAGSVYIVNNKSGNFSISIALSDHTELINQLSKKKSEKEVGYLTGITKSEIEEEFTKWLQLI